MKESSIQNPVKIKDLGTSRALVQHLVRDSMKDWIGCPPILLESIIKLVQEEDLSEERSGSHY